MEIFSCKETCYHSMQTFVWVHIDKIEFYIYDPSTSPSLPSVVYCYVLKNYYWFRAMSKRIGVFDILILIYQKTQVKIVCFFLV